MFDILIKEKIVASVETEELAISLVNDHNEKDSHIVIHFETEGECKILPRPPYLITSIYCYGTHGDYRLWGNKPTIEASTRLEAGWGFDPSDEVHNYDWHSWDADETGDYETKEEFLSIYWKACKERCSDQ